MSGNESSHDELRREASELRASYRRVVTTADDERRSIEGELHDGAMQYLVAFGVNLQLARGLVDTDSDALTELLDELLRNVHEALDDVRKLAWRVYPSLLVDCGLGDALRTAASMAGTDAAVDAAAIGRYSRETEAAVYFCCVRLLQDAAAGGHHATVRVQRERDRVRFDVTVAGADFEQWAMRDLRSLSDRLGAFGGSLSLTPALEPERGVRISGAMAIEPDGQAVPVPAVPSPVSAR